jgi:spore maturation protein CgeB
VIPAFQRVPTGLYDMFADMESIIFYSDTKELIEKANTVISDEKLQEKILRNKIEIVKNRWTPEAKAKELMRIWA